jgi:hypothetical protein
MIDTSSDKLQSSCKKLDGTQATVNSHREWLPCLISGLLQLGVIYEDKLYLGHFVMCIEDYWQYPRYT